MESSNRSNFGLANKARAMAIRCFCPPDNVTPRSPMTVSYPSGVESINLSICALLAAVRISSSVAFGLEKLIFSFNDAANKKMSCSTQTTSSLIS